MFTFYDEYINSMTRFGVDPFRYFLLSSGRIDADNDFSIAKVAAAVNELANTVGNLQLRYAS